MGKYVVVFQPNTCGYRCHLRTCTAATHTLDKPWIRNPRSRIPQEFKTIEEARAWSDNDESQKAGEPVKASFKVCECARHRCALCDKLLAIGYEHATCQSCVDSGKL